MFRKIIISSLLFLFTIVNYAQESKKVIYLGWKNVISISLKDNLALKSKILDYEVQEKEQWRAITSFLPVFSYQGTAIRNLELPVFIFMGQQFVVGTNYSFQHTLDLSLPVFSGGMRWFNLSAQKSLRKSLSEELKGKESETVLTALQAYYNIILSNELMKTAGEAVKVAKENLDQVEKYYREQKRSTTPRFRSLRQQAQIVSFHTRG